MGQSIWKQDAVWILAVVAAGTVLGLLFNWNVVTCAWQGPEAAAREGPAAGGFRTVSLAELKAALDAREILVVDARREFFYQKEHIPAAVSFPLAQYEQYVAAFSGRTPKDRELVIYCSGYGCEDSHQLAEKLVQAGYRRVGVFAGGMPEWKQAGYPTETGQSEPR